MCERDDVIISEEEKQHNQYKPVRVLHYKESVYSNFL